MYTILVADDDPDLRGLLYRVLSDEGHMVLTAADGYEAVRRLAERWVDLLITDIRMPGIDGFELADQAKLMRPLLHVIYISGYVPRLPAGRQIYGTLLEKPVRPEHLRSAVRSELRAGLEAHSAG